ncbi:hypothetical protein NPX13_g7210 [Xylaria arbuscula]|uniref:HTH CENPB-type domain-containing protein n=1 Tax=Xylaria arbuscula TaxID=114810 RepID=A0A9W8NB41_9PEZI|nr:hypothetical protein NPX13_g7210 [Xylaria arbuscula]
MPPYSENDVLAAVAAISNGVSLRKASREYGVPRTTLQDRIMGVRPKTIAYRDRQKLSVVQEDTLARWVTTQSSLGQHPDHQELRRYALEMLKAAGEPEQLGKRWVNRFLRRYPLIRVMRKRAIDFRRINGATPDVIRSWFQKLAILAVQAIKPENRYNFNEADIMEGHGTNGLVLGSTESKAIRKTRPGSRVWTSFIGCVSATGRWLDPLVIFKGKSLQQQWFPLNLAPYAGWHFTHQEKSWTDDDTALEWLQKIFIPNTVPEGTREGQRPNEARLLVCDGHGSHVKKRFMELCCIHNIYMLYLPPHASHVLQPLDMAIFGPLKHAYRKRLDRLAQMDDSTISGKRTFLSCYREARNEALTVSNIRAGWRGSGLWPVAVSRPLMNPLVLKEKPKAVRSQSLPPESRSQQVSQVTWETPRTASQLRNELRLFNRLDADRHTKLLLFRKINKAFSERYDEIGQQKRELEMLRARLDNIQTRKRKKVEMSPNSRFATIQDIYRSQQAADDGKIITSELNASDLFSDAESCIVVA